MLDKLDAIKGRFDNLGVALTNPEIVSDNKKYTSISERYIIILAFFQQGIHLASQISQSDKCS